MAQPSASQRLGRLERRLGVVAFDRDTRGARTTAAGRELVHQAEHILGHLDAVAEAVRAATAVRSMVVGTFASLAGSLFPVLDELLAPASLTPRVDHGDRLVEWVAEGTLTGAFVAIADQLVLPREVAVHVIGRDQLAIFVPRGVAVPGRGRNSLRGQGVAWTTYDLAGPEVHARLAALGAIPRRAATMGAALTMARRAGQVAVVPRSAAVEGLQDGEQVADLPFVHPLWLSLITPRDADPRLLAVLPQLREALGLEVVDARSGR